MTSQPHGPVRALIVLRLVLLGMSGLAVIAGLSSSPSANVSLRAAGPSGDWRQATPPAFYDAGDYYFEIGYAYIFTLAREELERRDGSSSTFEDRAALLDDAKRLLQESLRRSPADARSWAALGLVSALQQDSDGLAQSLKRSWTLAPYSAALAGLRLMTLAVVTPESLDEDARAAVLRDLKVMRNRQPRTLEMLVAGAPSLADLIGRLEAAMP